MTAVVMALLRGIGWHTYAICACLAAALAFNYVQATRVAIAKHEVAALTAERDQAKKDVNSLIASNRSVQLAADQCLSSVESLTQQEQKVSQQAALQISKAKKQSEQYRSKSIQYLTLAPTLSSDYLDTVRLIELELAKKEDVK